MGNKTSKSNPENVKSEVTANDMRLFLDELQCYTGAVAAVSIRSRRLSHHRNDL